jgi:hypothetical protein
MNFGDIWSSRKITKNNYIYTKKNKKINNTLLSRDSLLNTNKNIVFNSIFSAKTGNNVVHSKINDDNRSIVGFSQNNNNSGSKYWGTPTWYLFHSLAEKVNEEKYKKHYMIMWNFIKEVCAALPCPYCKAHATNYVNGISILNINTKQKLITTLFNFHNDVNLRTGKRTVGVEVLEKYKSSNLNKILELFYRRFFVSYIGRRHFDDWIKNKIKDSTQKFWIFYKKHLL